MHRLLEIAKKLVYERKLCVFYRNTAAQGDGESYSAIRVYETYAGIPSDIRKRVFRLRLINVMYYRLKSGDAQLLCYSEDGETLQAIGWVQSWVPFRRKFKEIADDGAMLGPNWTAPEHRGKGILGKLLLHSIFLCPKNKPVLVYTAPDNIASQRGIEKVGFELMGEWVVTIWFRCLVFTRKLDASESAL